MRPAQAFAPVRPVGGATFSANAFRSTSLAEAQQRFAAASAGATAGSPRIDYNSRAPLRAPSRTGASAVPGGATAAPAGNAYNAFNPALRPHPVVPGGATAAPAGNAYTAFNPALRPHPVVPRAVGPRPVVAAPALLQQLQQVKQEEEEQHQLQHQQQQLQQLQQRQQLQQVKQEEEDRALLAANGIEISPPRATRGSGSGGGEQDERGAGAPSVDMLAASVMALLAQAGAAQGGTTAQQLAKVLRDVADQISPETSPHPFRQTTTLGSAATTLNPLAALKASNPWGWSKGDAKAERSRSRDDKDRTRTKERSRERDKGREAHKRARSRSREKSRTDEKAAEKKLPEAAPAPPEDVQAEKLEEKGEGTTKQWRASCNYPTDSTSFGGAGMRRITALGPWRFGKSEADDDLKCMRNGFYRGSTPGLQDAKNELHRSKGRSKPPSRRSPSPMKAPSKPPPRISTSALDDILGELLPPGTITAPEAADASAEIDLTGDSQAPCQEQQTAQQPFEVEGPNKDAHFRVLCKFQKQNDWRPAGDQAKYQVVTGPWRPERPQAEQDGWSFLQAYEEGGLGAVRERRNKIHTIRSKHVAEADTPGDGGSANVECSTREGNSLFRANCSFRRPGADDEEARFNKNALNQSLLGPWRQRKEDAESDSKALAEAFERGGIEAASTLKNELRRTAKAETPTERNAVIPKGEFDQEQMDERYGPGLAMMKKMGYTVGASLGTSGEGGITIPINALDDKGVRRSHHDKEGLSGQGEESMVRFATTILGEASGVANTAPVTRFVSSSDK